MTRRLILTLALLFCTRFLFAGDVATFVNLGFSPDAQYFLFGEYGITESSKPYAMLYEVNVPKNTFAPNAVRTKTYDVSVEPGQTGLGALFSLFADFVPISKHYHNDHLLTGRDLYLLVDGEQPKSSLEFRDFIGGTDYSVALKQTKYGSGSTVSASFAIDLTITTKPGKKLHYTIGLPNYRRQGVENYRIRKILLAPDKKSLVFVIEERIRDKDGVNVRYMVETVRTAL